MPPSLCVPQSPEDDPCPNISKITQRKRVDVIEKEYFPKDKKYKDSYKKKDIKDTLESLYHSKCCYCERKVERWDVEHFRPTSKYPWLAYSWDNLLFSCPTCNQDYKKGQFEILGPKATFDLKNLSEINRLASTIAYQHELPSLIHPELENPEDHWKFTVNGKMGAVTQKGKDTIRICGLDRQFLREQRKEIIDEVEKIANAKKLTSSSQEEDEKVIRQLIRDFSEKAYNEKKEFLAFRQYVLKHLLSKILNRIFTNEE